MNSLNSNNKENVVNQEQVAGSSTKAVTAPTPSAALSFRERLEQQLKKAKDLQKQAQMDLESSKKEPKPEEQTSQPKTSTFPATTTSATTTTTFPRYSTFTQREITPAVSALSITSSAVKSEAESKFSSISARLGQLRESLMPQMSSSAIRPSFPLSSQSTPSMREFKSEIKTSSSALDSRLSFTSQLRQRNEVASTNQDNQDCMIVEEKSTLKQKQAELEICIEIEQNPKDLISAAKSDQLNKSDIKNSKSSLSETVIINDNSTNKSNEKSQDSKILQSNQYSSKNESEYRSPFLQSDSKYLSSSSLLARSSISSSNSFITTSSLRGQDSKDIHQYSSQITTSSNLKSGIHLSQNISKQEEPSVESKPIAKETQIIPQTSSIEIIAPITSLNQTPTDILKIIDNLPSSSSESDLSQSSQQNEVKLPTQIQQSAQQKHEVIVEEVKEKKIETNEKIIQEDTKIVDEKEQINEEMTRLNEQKEQTTVEETQVIEQKEQITVEQVLITENKGDAVEQNTELTKENTSIAEQMTQIIEEKVEKTEENANQNQQNIENEKLIEKETIEEKEEMDIEDNAQIIQESKSVELKQSIEQIKETRMEVEEKPIEFNNDINQIQNNDISQIKDNEQTQNLIISEIPKETVEESQPTEQVQLTQNDVDDKSNLNNQEIQAIQPPSIENSSIIIEEDNSKEIQNKQNVNNQQPLQHATILNQDNIKQDQQMQQNLSHENISINLKSDSLSGYEQAQKIGDNQQIVQQYLEIISPYQQLLNQNEKIVEEVNTNILQKEDLSINQKVQEEAQKTQIDLQTSIISTKDQLNNQETSTVNTETETAQQYETIEEKPDIIQNSIQQIDQINEVTNQQKEQNNDIITSNSITNQDSIIKNLGEEVEETEQLQELSVTENQTKQTEQQDMISTTNSKEQQETIEEIQLQQQLQSTPQKQQVVEIVQNTEERNSSPKKSLEKISQILDQIEKIDQEDHQEQVQEEAQVENQVDDNIDIHIIDQTNNNQSHDDSAIIEEQNEGSVQQQDQVQQLISEEIQILIIPKQIEQTFEENKEAMIIENHPIIEDNNSVQKIVSSNKSSTQKQQSLQSIISQIEESEKMDVEDEEQEIDQVNSNQNTKNELTQQEMFEDIKLSIQEQNENKVGEEVLQIQQEQLISNETVIASQNEEDGTNKIITDEQVTINHNDNILGQTNTTSPQNQIEQNTTQEDVQINVIVEEKIKQDESENNEEQIKLALSRIIEDNSSSSSSSSSENNSQEGHQSNQVQLSVNPQNELTISQKQFDSIQSVQVESKSEQNNNINQSELPQSEYHCIEPSIQQQAMEQDKMQITTTNTTEGQNISEKSQQIIVETVQENTLNQQLIQQEKQQSIIENENQFIESKAQEEEGEEDQQNQQDQLIVEQQQQIIENANTILSENKEEQIKLQQQEIELPFAQKQIINVEEVIQNQNKDETTKEEQQSMEKIVEQQQNQNDFDISTSIKDHQEKQHQIKLNDSNERIEVEEKEEIQQQDQDLTNNVLNQNQSQLQQDKEEMEQEGQLSMNNLESNENLQQSEQEEEKLTAMDVEIETNVDDSLENQNDEILIDQQTNDEILIDQQTNDDVYNDQQESQNDDDNNQQTYFSISDNQIIQQDKITTEQSQQNFSSTVESNKDDIAQIDQQQDISSLETNSNENTNQIELVNDEKKQNQQTVNVENKLETYDKLEQKQINIDSPVQNTNSQPQLSEKLIKSDIKIEDIPKIGSIMNDMESYLKKRGLSDIKKDSSSSSNYDLKNNTKDMTQSRIISSSLIESALKKEEISTQISEDQTDHHLITKQVEIDPINFSSQKKTGLQLNDLIGVNNSILSQMDSLLSGKKQKNESSSNLQNNVETNNLNGNSQIISSGKKNIGFQNPDENIFERIKRESDKKLKENGADSNKSDKNNSLNCTNIFTPSNAKMISEGGGNQTQFSNDSFGITPKKINFLLSNKKVEDESNNEGYQQINQNQQRKSNEIEEEKQSQQGSNQNSQIANGNPNTKGGSAELKLRTPFNNQAVHSMEIELEKKQITKAPSSYTVISNRNNVLKSPVIANQKGNKIIGRNRSSSKSPARQIQVAPKQSTAVHERQRSKSPRNASINKSANRDDISISSVNMSRFDLENEELDKYNQQTSDETSQKKIAIPGDLAKIAQTLGIAKHNRNQCQLIDQIINQNQNICKFMLNQSGKNILYQTLALLEDSLPNHFIVVVTNQFITLRQKMNKSVSWACINSSMGVDTLVQVQNLLMERKIKLLFVQQEQLLLEQLRFMKDQIKMIIYEDQTDKIQEINDIYNIQRYHLFNTTGFKTNEQVGQLCEKFTLKNMDENISLYGFDFTNIHWTFESDKEKSFINFIRKNNLRKVIMFIDKSKKIDELVSSFNQKGLKMQAYNSQRADQIQQLLQKDQFEILCCYNGQYIPRQIKQMVQFYIHYHMPRSIVSYLNDMNGFQYYHINKGILYEKFACGFLTELDFFEIRSAMVQDLTEKKLIDIVLKTLNNNGSDGQQNQNKKKAASTTQQSDDFFFNVVLDETEIKIRDHYNNLMKEEEGYNKETDTEANIKQIQISKFINENFIKRELLIKILSYIAADQVQIMPYQGQIKVIQKNLLVNNKIVNTILKNNQNKTSITFSILDIASELQMTSQELNRSLKKLNTEKKLQYEVKEEIALLTIKPNIEQIFDKLFEEIRFQEEKQINDLDTMYLSAKITCNLTLEQVFKYQKYKDMNKNSNQSEDAILSLKTLLEKYLNEVKGSDMCQMFSVAEKCKLPFISLKSQREKSNLLKDIQNLIPRVIKSKLNLQEFQLNRDISLMDFESQSRFISLIMQGIDGKNINEFKPALQFKKYFKYDYFDILQISFEYLQTYYTQLLQSETSKRIKI